LGTSEEPEEPGHQFGYQGRVDATAVVVNHNSGPRLGPLLEALLGEVGTVVVVDNASSDHSIQTAEGRDRVGVVRNDANRGFAAAANQGARSVTSEWLVFVNPDAQLRPGQVQTLLSGVPADVAAVAPLQVDQNDLPRSETGGYEPTLSRYLVWALVPVRFHRRRGPWLAPPWPQSDMDLAWVSGALLGVRRAVFESLGRFDERFFLYHEDVDLCRQARRAGYRVICRPSVRLVHEVAHGDPRRRVTSGLRSVESLALDFTGPRRRALGAVLGIGFGLRALFASGTARELARAVLPHCRTLLRGELPKRSA
jgi:N-acetylglucosaminyl-diphospho-decaprenol L-rhamnosyltransferase